MTVAKEEKATNLIDQIKEVKKLIKGRSFNAAYEILKGFNRDIDLFDYNYGDFVSTIYRLDKITTLEFMILTVVVLKAMN